MPSHFAYLSVRLPACVYMLCMCVCVHVKDTQGTLAFPTLTSHPRLPPPSLLWSSHCELSPSLAPPACKLLCVLSCYSPASMTWGPDNRRQGQGEGTGLFIDYLRPHDRLWLRHRPAVSENLNHSRSLGSCRPRVKVPPPGLGRCPAACRCTGPRCTSFLKEWKGAWLRNP